MTTQALGVAGTELVQLTEFVGVCRLFLVIVGAISARVLHLVTTQALGVLCTEVVQLTKLVGVTSPSNFVYLEAYSTDGIPVFLSWFSVDQLVILTMSGSTLLSHGIVFFECGFSHREVKVP